MSRITLAPVRRADAPDLIAAHIANRAYHHPWVSPCTDESGFDAWFGKRVIGPNVSLVARDLASAGIVGVVDLDEIVWGSFRSAYVGFHGMAEFAHRGLMTEAVILAAAHAWHELGLHRLEANVQPANAASLALVRRAGFHYEGLSPRYLRIDGAWRDHERWACLAP